MFVLALIFLAEERGAPRAILKPGDMKRPASMKLVMCTKTYVSHSSIHFLSGFGCARVRESGFRGAGFLARLGETRDSEQI